MSSLKKIPIVFYHSIGPVLKNWNRNYLTTDANAFEEHLKYFKKNHTVISLDDYYNIRSGVLESPKKPLVITMDDGFLDNWIWAFPLLKKYNLKATIFVIPEMVDPRNVIRINLEDVWNKKAKEEDLEKTGYMSWNEMSLMEKSGLIDIQSHTSTHTKYFVSDKLVNFHHKGVDCLYPIGNIFPDKKPYHIVNSDFEALIPFGTPYFEEKSSVIARKVTINSEFVNECVNVFKEYDFSNYNFESAYKEVQEVYRNYQSKNRIVLNTESDEDFYNRMSYEIVESKKEIEKRLNKKIEFLCWPHGDNSEEVHEIAIRNGYKATTAGKINSSNETIERISKRIGYRPYLKNSKLGFIRLKTLIKEVEGNNTGKLIRKLFKIFKP